MTVPVTLAGGIKMTDPMHQPMDEKNAGVPIDGILIEPEGPPRANPQPMQVITPGHYSSCYVCGLDMRRLDPSAQILRTYERNGKPVYVISYCYWCWHGILANGNRGNES